MRLFYTHRESARRTNRTIRWFFAAMGILTVLFALFLLGRLVLEQLPWA